MTVSSNSPMIKHMWSRIGENRTGVFFVLVLCIGFPQARAQSLIVQSPVVGLTNGTAPPLTITLQDAVQRARLNDPQYRSALTDLGLAQQDRVQARAGLLPNLSLNNSFIYTQGTGEPALATSKFIANNGVHEYISQADVHQSVSLTTLADYRRSAALLAQSRAKAEIATRGLVVTVTQAYYGLVVAQRKYANSQRAASEAQRFLGISQKLENGGEVARADVIKAQIQAHQQERDLQ
jgi:outer membrane protein TolC